MDIAKTYANIIATTYLDGGMIPMIMNTDEEAIRLAVKTVVRVKPQDCKIVRIRNTLELVDIHVSEPLMTQVRANPAEFEVVGEPEALKFDAKGNLYPMLAKHLSSARVTVRSSAALSRPSRERDGRDCSEARALSRQAARQRKAAQCTSTSTPSAAWPATCSSPPCWTPSRICGRECCRRSALAGCRRTSPAASSSTATMC